jgi:MFS family permease
VRSDTRLALDAVQLAVGSTLFLGALTVGSLPIGIAMAVVGVGLALLALRHLLPPGSLRLGRGRPSVFAACFAVAFAFFGTEAFVPLTIVEIRDSTTTIGGLALSAAAVSWATGSWLQARAAGAGIRRTLVVLGFVLIAVGIAVTSLILLPATPLPLAAVGWGIAGLGMGLAFSMLSLLVLETATPGEEGISSAGLQLMFTLGTAFGAGIGGAVVALAEDGHLGLSPALGVVNGGMLVVALLGLLIALRVPRRPTAAAATDLSGARPISFEHP